MAFGQTPTTTTEGSLASNQVFLSSVATPGTANGDLTALEGGPISTDSNSNKTAPASMYVKDGANVGQGTKADSAATDSTSSWSVIALLKGLYAKLAGTLTVGGSVSVSNLPATQPVSIAATVADNVAQVNGSAIIANTSDGVAGTGVVPVALYSYNGTTWDRVHSANSGGNQGVLKAGIAATDGTAVQAQSNLSDAMGGVSGLCAISFAMQWNGTSWDRARVPTVFKYFNAQAITAGTAAALWTPASGKKFRVMGYALSLSVAGAFIFKDAPAAILVTPAVTAGGNTRDNIGNGILSTASNNALNIDVSASGTVSGYVYGTEE